MAVVDAVPVEPIGGSCRTARWRLAAGVALAGLVAYLVSGVAYEWGRPDQPATVAQSTSAQQAAGAADGTRAQAERDGVDLEDVIDLVSHRVTPVPGEAGVLESVDDRYRAVFDGSGFALDDFKVSLTTVRRGDRAVPLGLGPWRGEANVASRQISGGVTERVTARDGELEWDLVLDRPLPGEGDLVVEAGVTGSVGVAVSDGDGLVFGAEGPDVRMGSVVVKDARGRVLHRASPKTSGDGVSLVVPARVLDDAAYPVTIDPTVGPEHPVSDPVSSDAANSQSSPAVAFDGTNYLVVWQDFRSRTDHGIFGARVSRAGAVLDGFGIPISPAAANDQSVPAVAFDGTNYLVVWQEPRSGTRNDIIGARVSRAGVVLDGSGIPISTATGGQFSPAVAFDGTNYLVVWADGRSGTGLDIFGARVSRAGAVLNRAGIPISTAATDQFSAAVAFDGTNYLVVWQDLRSAAPGYDIYGARVSRAGAVLNSAGIPISTAANDQFSAAVAFDGTNYLVVWQDSRSGPHTDIYGARVSRAGAVLSSAGIPISTAANSQVLPAVAFDGTNYRVVWHDQRSGGAPDIYGARVSRAGAVIDGSGIPISTASANSQSSPAVAFDGTNFLVVWQDLDPETSWDIIGARVSRSGAVLDGSGISMSTAANSQTVPAVAFDGTNYLVVWQDLRSRTDYDIYGARVSRAGAVLDGSGIPISTAAFHQSIPEVAFDGTNYLVVWEDSRSLGSDVYGTRVSRAGVVLNGSGIAISTAANFQFSPAVAFDGTNYLVVWEDSRSGSSDVYGTRVSRAGAVLNSAGIPISTAANDQSSPAVAFDGTNYLVVWQHSRSRTSFDIYGTRVSRAGAVLNSAGIPISTAANDQSSPAVAFDGTNYLVVWQDLRSGTTYDIYGARVSRAGTVWEPAGFAISAASKAQDSPQIAVNGSFLVVWHDHRSNTSWDVYGTRVNGAGGVLDGDGFAIAKSPTDEQAPALTADPRTTGRFGIVYQRFAPEDPYGANRVFLRTSPK